MQIASGFTDRELTLPARRGHFVPAEELSQSSVSPSARQRRGLPSSRKIILSWRLIHPGCGSERCGKKAGHVRKLKQRSPVMRNQKSGKLLRLKRRKACGGFSRTDDIALSASRNKTTRNASTIHAGTGMDFALPATSRKTVRKQFASVWETVSPIFSILECLTF